MSLLETLRIVGRALRANKLRSGLAMLGVVIGVGAVIAIMSMGATFKGTIAGEINRFGAGTLFIIPGDGKIGAAMPISTLTFEDEQAIRSDLPVDLSSPAIDGGGIVQYQDKTITALTTGVNEHFEDLRNWHVATGSFFTKEQVDGKAAVAVIGESLRDALFGKDVDPVGKVIQFQKRDVRIVGLLKRNTVTMGVADVNMVLVLPHTFIADAMDIRKPTSLYVRFKSPELATEYKAKIEQLLLDRHGVKDFAVMSQEELLSTIGNILDNVTIFIGAVAAIALLVGGVGIMNIMLVSVKERTREIGLRKAIGARRRDILLQFLTEAAVLSVIGGVIGILAGLGLSYLGVQALSWTFVPSGTAVVLGFGFSAAVGIFFGFYPAFTASRLPAVEALRYE